MASRTLTQQELLRLVGRVCRRRRTRGFLVGGPVRDRLLGRESPDIDIAVESGMPGLGQAVAREAGGGFVFHQRFLTGTVTLPDARHIDICQTRTETYARPGALPQVRPATIEQDLARRDFSINAMALEITEGAFGRIIDPLGGRADLKARLVRVLHPRSFVDDPSRIFRAIRFATRLEYEIEPGTLDMMRLAVAARYPSLLSPERILYELRMMCAEPLVLQMTEAVLAEGVLQSAWAWQPDKALLPGLKRLVESRASQLMLYVYLLGFLPLTDRFPVRSEERAGAEAIAGFPKLRARVARLGRMSALHRLLKPVPDVALAILAVTEPAVTGRQLARYFESRVGARPTISGADLKALGIRPGPEYGRLLEAVTLAKLDGRARTREEELALVRRRAAR